MRAITIEAKSLDSAVGIRDALSQFNPDLRSSDSESYQISIDLSGSERRIIDILGVLERHITSRSDGPAHVELDGRSYTMDGDATRSESG